MSSQQSPTPIKPTPPAPTLPPFWKWLMRITFVVTMVLFFAPTVYVVKYYAVDRPREEALAAIPMPDRIAPTADYLPALEKRARDTRTGSRLKAVRQISMILQQPGINYERPLECLSAKATLAGLATKDLDPAVRAEASAELGKVAQGGAVIRR